MYDEAYYESLRPASGMGRFVDDRRDTIVARLVRDRAPRGRLLDVGCGRGDLLARLMETHSVTGIELSEAALALARTRLPDATLVAADIQQGLPFAEDFDAITAINVIEHLSDPTAGAATLARHQAPGGVLIVHLPTAGNPMQRWFYDGSYDQDPTHVYRPSGRQVIDLFESVGYRLDRSAYAPFTPLWLWGRLPAHPAFLAAFVKE